MPYPSVSESPRMRIVNGFSAESMELFVETALSTFESVQEREQPRIIIKDFIRIRSQTMKVGFVIGTLIGLIIFYSYDKTIK